MMLINIYILYIYIVFDNKLQIYLNDPYYKPASITPISPSIIIIIIDYVYLSR